MSKYTIQDKDERVLAACGLHNENGDEDEANARLIAAAPEMLEAVKACLEWMEYTIPHLKTNCPHCRGVVDAGGLNWGGPIKKARAAIALAEGWSGSKGRWHE